MIFFSVKSRKSWYFSLLILNHTLCSRAWNSPKVQYSNIVPITLLYHKVWYSLPTSLSFTAMISLCSTRCFAPPPPWYFWVIYKSPYLEFTWLHSAWCLHLPLPCTFGCFAPRPQMCQWTVEISDFSKILSQLRLWRRDMFLIAYFVRKKIKTMNGLSIRYIGLDQGFSNKNVYKNIGQ